LQTIAHAFDDFSTKSRHQQTRTCAINPNPSGTNAPNQNLMLVLTRARQPFVITPHDFIHIARSLRRIMHGFHTCEATAYPHCLTTQLTGFKHRCSGVLHML
jgi:hypothetical protein